MLCVCVCVVDLESRGLGTIYCAHHAGLITVIRARARVYFRARAVGEESHLIYHRGTHTARTRVLFSARSEDKRIVVATIMKLATIVRWVLHKSEFHYGLL